MPEIRGQLLLRRIGTGLAGLRDQPDRQGQAGRASTPTICRAIGGRHLRPPPRKSKFAPLSAKDRFTALQAGRGRRAHRARTTWTLSRDTSLGLNFAAHQLFRRPGFHGPQEAGREVGARSLPAPSVCTQQGTTTELNLADYFRANKLKYEAGRVRHERLRRSKAYEAGRCDAFTTDCIGPVCRAPDASPNPDEHIVLPDIVSKEPLGPGVRHGGDQWLDMVKWAHYAMLHAEELGVAQGQCGTRC